MKIYIETDIEGIAGFCFSVDKVEEKYQAAYYAKMCRLLTLEVNAAVEGAFEAGADEVVVHDNHGTGYNIDVELLHPEARIIHGLSTYAPDWQTGLDASVTAVLGVGGHVMKDTNGITPHTLFTVNDTLRLGEFHMTAALAGWLDIPFIFASGDNYLEEQLRELVPNLEYAAVKKAYSPYYAEAVSPVKARTMIKTGVKRAIARLNEIKPYKLPCPPPYKVNILGSDYQDPNAIAINADFPAAVMKTLESIFHYELPRQTPWPMMPRGVMKNKHQLIAEQNRRS